MASGLLHSAGDLGSLSEGDRLSIVPALSPGIGWLAAPFMAAAVVVVARSRLSGFTPADQWAFIERTLLERLGALYDLDGFTIDVLAARAAVADAWPAREVPV